MTLLEALQMVLAGEPASHNSERQMDYQDAVVMVNCSINDAKRALATDVRLVPLRRAGRRGTPTHCAKCGAACESWTKAQRHCKKEAQ